MNAQKLTTAQLEMLKRLAQGPGTVSQLARDAGRSISWTSHRITKLADMGFVTKRKTGLTVHVAIVDSRMGDDLRVLLNEEAYVDLAEVLAGPGLSLLPMLLPPGASLRSLRARTHYTERTIRSKLRRWQGMGLAVRQGRSGAFVLGRSWPRLRRFVIDYKAELNNRWLRAKVPSATVIWQWRDEMLFSTERRLSGREFRLAAATRLEELGFDIVPAREYYMAREGGREVSVEEALVQTLKVDPMNPRGERRIREALQDGRIDPRSMVRLAGIYGLKRRMTRLVRGNGTNVWT